MLYCEQHTVVANSNWPSLLSMIKQGVQVSVAETVKTLMLITLRLVITIPIHYLRIVHGSRLRQYPLQISSLVTLTINHHSMIYSHRNLLTGIKVLDNAKLQFHTLRCESISRKSVVSLPVSKTRSKILSK